jgi:hypothetical protein
MASSSILTRETKSGARRYVVRYRLGGRRLVCPARRLALDHGGGPRAPRPDRGRARSGSQPGRGTRGGRPGRALARVGIPYTYSHVMPLDELAAERLRALMGS